MQTKRIDCLIAICLLICALVCPAMAEDGPIVASFVLPQGEWQAESAEWRFCLAENLQLTQKQQALLGDQASALSDGGLLEAGTLLTAETLYRLYPGAEVILGMPPEAETLPGIEMFALTGTWIETEAGALSYNPGDGLLTMTREEVFTALSIGERHTATDNPKTVYLTIDDSPSQYTMELLSELERLDVEATFFVVGAYVAKYPLFLREIYRGGHTIGNHSYSHDGKTLASSLKSSYRDFQRCEESVADALGFSLAMPILRIPYGSSTIPEDIRTELQRMGYMWIDWNTLNGDTESGVKSDADALKRAFTTGARYDGDLVMLVHDGKKRTIRTLEALVEHFRAEGYEFRALRLDIDKMPGVRIGFPLTD